MFLFPQGRLGLVLPPRENPADFLLDVVTATARPEPSSLLFSLRSHDRSRGRSQGNQSHYGRRQPAHSLGAVDSARSGEFFPPAAVTAAWKTFRGQTLGCGDGGGYGSLEVGYGSSDSGASGSDDDDDVRGRRITPAALGGGGGWRSRVALAAASQPPWAAAFRLFCARAAIELLRYPGTFL